LAISAARSGSASRIFTNWRDIPEEEARSAVALAEEALAFVKLRLADEGGL
jgi:hypothetical protein